MQTLAKYFLALFIALLLQIFPVSPNIDRPAQYLATERGEADFKVPTRLCSGEQDTRSAKEPGQPLDGNVEAQINDAC